ALVVDGEGALVAANEAAEALFGQGLGLLARGRCPPPLPPGSALVALLNRAFEEDARVRERGLHISLFGLPPFEADGAAGPPRGRSRPVAPAISRGVWAGTGRLRTC